MSEDYKSTLIAASLLSWKEPKGHLVEGTRLDLLPDGPEGTPKFKIKAADSTSRRGLITGLLSARYAWRGYSSVELAARQSLERFTLVALDNEVPLGTITVAFDVGNKLGADDAFGPELDHLRAEGSKLCEFTKLAVDPTTATKRVLAALFHVAYLVAHRVREFDRLVIEVNPRHQRYYERMLGLQPLGDERMNRTVKAPAVLLTLAFSDVREQIDLLGGHPEQAANVRSLYPFAFSHAEEAAIIARLRRNRAQPDGSAADSGL
jgi:hypothetical protein